MSTPIKWGGEFLVNTINAGSQSQPTITALADGRFVAAWTDTSATGGDTSLYAVRPGVQRRRQQKRRRVPGQHHHDQ